MIDSKDSIDTKWSIISSHIQEFVTPQQYRTWFRSVTLSKCSDEAFTFTVPNKFLKTWISNYYMDVLRKSIDKALGNSSEASITIKIDPSAEPVIQESKPEVSGRDSSSEPVPEKQPEMNARHKISDDFFLNPNYSFGNFIVGPCNQLAYAASMSIADKPSSSYNPLFLHGSSGLGKTHLLHSVCQKVLAKEPSTKILFLSCETFINHFISSIEKGNLTNFRNKYRHIDILLIDDIHLLARKERTQEEFFHTFNSLFNSGKQIVLSSDSPPSEIPTIEERLVSRFKWGLVSPVFPPDLETRCAILKAKARMKNVDVPSEVVSFLAENINTNIRELEGAITKVVGYSTLMNREIDLDMAQEAMQDVIKSNDHLITIDHIVKSITKKFNVKLSDLQSKKRIHSIGLPRQISMFVIKNLTYHSLQEIGAYFGGRDHSTVLHAYNKISDKMKTDNSFKQLVSEIIDEITGKV